MSIRKKKPLTITSFSKDAEQPKLSHFVGKRENATTSLEKQFGGFSQLPHDQNIQLLGI